MTELKLPITKRQHDKAVTLINQQQTVANQLNAYCEAVLDASANRPEKAEVVGVSSDDDGTFALVLRVPEPPKAEA